MAFEKIKAHQAKMQAKNGYNWTEPGSFSKKYRRYPIVPWGYHVVAVGVFAFIASLPFWIPRNDLPWWGMTLFGLFAFGATYLIAYLDASSGAMVAVTKKGVQVCDSMMFTQFPILYLLGYRRKTHRWDTIASATIRRETIGKKECNVIELRDEEGDLIDTIGASTKSPDIEKVAEFMERERRARLQAAFHINHE